MPDISMCTGGDCPLKNDCYRYKATPNEYQSYFSYPPYSIDFNIDGTQEIDCLYFWNIKNAQNENTSLS